MIIKSLTHGPGLPPPWARDPKLSNGMLAEVNSHDWDCVRWLMGSDPARVFAETANFKGASRGVDDPDFYDTALVSIRFEDGGLGTISGVCPCDYGYDARVEIVGEKGIMQIGEIKGQARWSSRRSRQGARHARFTEPGRSDSPGATSARWSTSSTASAPAPSRRSSGIDGRWAVAWRARRHDRSRRNGR